MSMTPEQEAIGKPYIAAAVELFKILKSDRSLAINLARHHGLIPGAYDLRMVEECLGRIAGVSAMRCAHVVGRRLKRDMLIPSHENAVGAFACSDGSDRKVRHNVSPISASASR